MKKIKKLYDWQDRDERGLMLRLAARRGIPAILNPAPAHRIPLEQLRRFDAILPNLQEAGALLGVEAKSMALAPLAAALRVAPSAVLTAYAAQKVSPAPVVSTTFA